MRKQTVTCEVCRKPVSRRQSLGIKGGGRACRETCCGTLPDGSLIGAPPKQKVIKGGSRLTPLLLFLQSLKEHKCMLCAAEGDIETSPGHMFRFVKMASIVFAKKKLGDMILPSDLLDIENGINEVVPTLYVVPWSGKVRNTKFSRDGWAVVRDVIARQATGKKYIMACRKCCQEHQLKTYSLIADVPPDDENAVAARTFLEAAGAGPVEIEKALDAVKRVQAWAVVEATRVMATTALS